MKTGHHFLAGGGEMGALMRSFDWASTPLGPVEAWPQSLRSAVSILLPSKAQIVLFWGPELVTLYNDAYRPVFGAKHPHALGMPVRESWSELWRAGLKELFEGVTGTGEAFWAKDRPFFLERHGYPEETFFDVSYDPVRDESGAVGGVFCIVSETTGRVVGERRLRTLRDLGARTSRAKSVEGVFRIAARVLAENPHDIPFAFFYFHDVEAGGRLISAAGQEDVPPPGDWPFAEISRTGKSQVLEELGARFGTLPGGPWPEPAQSAVALAITRSGQGAPYGFVVMGVCPRRRLDADYLSFLQLIANQIGSAVANALAYEEERKRAEALAELDRAKTLFFSNVSHEFRTPLSLMLGPVEDGLADAEEPLAPVQRERQELVRRSGLRLQKLVNTLLDFSRIEAGRAQASYVPTDLAALTADLASSFRSAVEKAGMKLALDCSSLPQPVYVDRDMWEKVVLNLLSNAFKFTFEGEIAVSLRSVGGSAELAVRDTGTGISAAELPQVFDRFRRIEGARSRTHEGTGIGLALVKELVKLHGGTVRAESVHGEGSTFTVSIPAGSAHLPADRIGAGRTSASTALGAQPYIGEAIGWLPDAESLPAAPRIDAGRERIVWADDNADMREYVCRLLSTRYEVETVVDGEAALAAVRARCPDLVLADVMMPKLDGLGLVRELRAAPDTRSLPIILLSARAGEESRIEGYDAGASDYLYKPFSARELLARISSRLELSRLQAQLEQERSSLARLFAQTPVPTAVLRGPQLVFEMANPAYVELVGRDVLGKPLLEALPEAKGQGFDDLLRGVLRSGAPHIGQEVLVRLERKGRIEDTFFTFIYAPLRSASGEIDRVIAIVNEVTEQVRAREAIRSSQEALRLSDERLRTALSNSDTGTFRWDPHTGDFLDTDASFKRLFGFEPDDPVRAAADVIARIHPDDMPAVGAAVEACAKGADFEMEFRVVLPDGGIRWLYERAKHVPAPVGAGAGSYVLGSITDVTKRKRAEEGLQESERRLRFMAESMPQKIFTARPNGEVDYFNPQWSEFTGLSFEQIRDWGWTRFIHPDDVKENVRVWQRSIDSGEPFHFEHRFRRADGEYRWHMSRALPMRDAAGRVVMWIGSNSDVHELKKVQEALKEAGRHKDEFLATLSHELRNPLAPIRNAVTLLQEADGEKELREQACAILDRQVNHMIRLVEDLLDISRISRGSIDLHQQPVSLAAVVESAAETSRPLIEAGGHRLQIGLPQEPIVLSADPVRLGQVIANLLNNAAKYTPHGGLIEVTARTEPGVVAISVRDNGIGIEADSLARVFEMFAQLDATRSRAPGGLGIGLALARQLVELHGGSIEARSEGPGRGSEFTVRLPTLASDRRPRMAMPKPALKSAIARRVLVVDDNVDTANSLGMLLEQMGHTVQLCHDGPAALAAARRNPPEIVLLDIDLPKLDGFAVARLLRQDHRLEAVPIVAVTGFGQDVDRKRARQAGFDEHLVKPVDADVLRATLELIHWKNEPAVRG